MNVDDGALIAYLDGQLPEAAYAPLEQALKDDEALRARLQALAESSELARRAFDATLLEPVPPSLIAAIWRAPDPRGRAVSPSGPSAAPQGAAGGWPTRVTGWLGLTPGQRPWPALASVLVLGFVAVVGWQWAASPGDARWAMEPGKAVTDQSLALVLDMSPSGRVLRTASDSVEVLASFAQAGGSYCREFNRISTNGTRDELGIACRTSEGTWQLDFLFRENRPARGADAGYQTASDRQHEAADAFLRERVQGAPLAEAEERALIERGWPTP